MVEPSNECFMKKKDYFDQKYCSPFLVVRQNSNGFTKLPHVVFNTTLTSTFLLDWMVYMVLCPAYCPEWAQNTDT